MIAARSQTRHGRLHEAEGFASAAALVAVLLAAALGASMAELARIETILAGSRTRVATALAAVDACTEHAAATLPAGWDFDAVVAGDDGTPGTADDGRLALPVACEGLATTAPGLALPARLLFTAEATRGRGRRRLEAILRRRAEPGVPALIWLANPAAIGSVFGTLALDGRDPAAPDDTVAALAGPGNPDDLDAWTGAWGGAVARTGTGSSIWTPAPPLASLLARAVAAGGVSPTVGLTTTPPAPPALIVAPGDLAVTTPRSGAGVLVVGGELRVADSLAFTGIVAALGGLRVEAAGDLDVQGAIWLDNASGDALVVDGRAQITASAAALAGADGLLTLPRRAMVAGVHDF